ncbi:unnamed protein product [Rotaria sp. Silwood1]|nr:unnamed protein product [Rotaria sp. Silwood1]
MISPINNRHSFLNGLTLLLNGSESCTSVYSCLIRIYSNFCLSLNKQGMTETNSILRSIIFEYNKKKCISWIIDPKFEKVVSSLEDLTSVNIDTICENITSFTIIIFRSILSNNNMTVNYHEHIQYYINKVSTHLWSLDSTLSCLKHRESDLGEIYKHIQWYFIEPIVELKEALSSTFDQIWEDAKLLEGDAKTNEIRMIDYLIEYNIKEAAAGDIEIGISKLSCYSCSLYIEQLNQVYNREFCIDSLVTHGKIYPDWTFRNNEDQFIKDRVNDKFYKLIIEEFIRWDSKERTKSSDSNKQETHIDDDDFSETIASRIYVIDQS